MGRRLPSYTGMELYTLTCKHAYSIHVAVYVRVLVCVCVCNMYTVFLDMGDGMYHQNHDVVTSDGCMQQTPIDTIQSSVTELTCVANIDRVH